MDFFPTHIVMIQRKSKVVSEAEQVITFWLKIINIYIYIFPFEIALFNYRKQYTISYLSGVSEFPHKIVYCLWHFSMFPSTGVSDQNLTCS